MILTIDRRLMDVMYGPRLKLFVARADAAHFSSELGGDSLDAMGIELIQYESADGTAGAARLQSFNSNGGEFVVMTTPPTGHCLLVTATPQGHEQLASLITWWRENGPNGAPELLKLDESSPSNQATWQIPLLRRFVEIAQSDARRSAEREVMVCGQLSELREEYEQARVAMQAMQDTLARSSPAPCNLSVALAPSNEIYRPRNDGETIRQPLFFRAEGLAAIDIFIPQSRSSAGLGEHFLVTLVARETPAPLGTWLILGDHLIGGWTRCAFPVALASPFHQLELLAQWCGSAENCPGLALSPVQPWNELCASVDGKPLSGALAHAVWCALPGIKTGFGSVPIRAAAGAEATFTHILGRDAIARIQATTNTAAHYLDPLPSHSGFRLHPLDGIVAAAVVPDACLTGTQSVTAVAQISHPAAKHPVDYAIALTRSSAKHRSFPEDARGADVVAISDWQSVPADGSPHVVGLTLTNACTNPLDLHVATRMSKDHPTAYQWADWLEVRITLRCLSPVMPVGM